jgi:hypothetical protein
VDWIADYLGFCLSHGFGGLALLFLTGGLAVMVLLAVVGAVSDAISKGRRSNV